jgi:hypothetical protein
MIRGNDEKIQSGNGGGKNIISREQPFGAFKKSSV